ncbi:uncharacterized protein LOC122531287 [Frieseomelitta varia]|uniref:uncharacterized protein LOC122531287 n=1 Tax=Frieseomelitta varia TaxID=561572 RepID=UPI001CB6AF8F|nr:uncharacterized protein LOC122531287 [Frieseomelitta varia]
MKNIARFARTCNVSDIRAIRSELVIRFARCTKPCFSIRVFAADFQRGVDPLDASWPPLQPVLGTLSTCRYSGSGQHVDFMRFYSGNYRTPAQKSVVFVVDR